MATRPHTNKHRPGPLPQTKRIVLLLAPFLFEVISRHSPSGTSNAFVVDALASPRPQIVVTPVKSQVDMVALADLRFDEWIAADAGNESPAPSRHAFRVATAEVATERSSLGAVAFIARIPDGAAVGSAELSPIEFDGAIPQTEELRGVSMHKPLYATDLVTSSSHRRMGVGDAIMNTIEEHAVDVYGATVLFLHVHPNNVGALKFYSNPKRGYGAVSTDGANDALGGMIIDYDRLAKNAGTVGQVLLSKSLPRRERIEEAGQRSLSSGTGFGGVKGSARSTKAKKKKHSSS